MTEAENIMEKAELLIADAMSCMGDGRNRIAGGLFEQAASLLAEHGHYEQAILFWTLRFELTDQDTAPHWFNFAYGLEQQGKIQTARFLYQNIIDRWPDHAFAWMNLGGIEEDTGQHDIARSYYSRALTLTPNLGPALYNLARLTRSEDPLRAASLYQQILAADPLHGVASFEAGSLYAGLEKFQDAIECFRASLATTSLPPEKRITARAYIAYARVMGGVGPQKEINRAIEDWAADLLPQCHPFDTSKLPEAGQKLRISLYTMSLGHSVPFPIERVAHALCQAIRRQGVESWIYVLPNNSSEPLPDFCIDLRKKTHDEAYDIIINDQNHALITMDFLPISDLRFYLRRPAPIILAWWHCISSQSQIIDGILVDKWYIPDEIASDFSDNIHWLSGSSTLVVPNEYAPDVAPLPAQKNGYITFGSFNRPSKINSETLELWSLALKQVKNSRLYLRSSTYNAYEENRILSELRCHGISEENVEIHFSTGIVDFLTSYGNIDISLDTINFTGGITTIETLWQGVPVVTLPGNLLTSRISASVLASAGLTDWIARDKAHWLEIVTSLAADLPALAAHRANLRNIMANSSAVNPDLMAKDLLRAIMPLIENLPLRPSPNPD